MLGIMGKIELRKDGRTILAQDDRQRLADCRRQFPQFSACDFRMQPQADDCGMLSGERLYREPAVPPDGSAGRQVEPVIGRTRLARDQQTAIAVWHYPAPGKGTATPDAAFPQTVKKTLDRLQLRTIT